MIEGGGEVAFVCISPGIMLGICVVRSAVLMSLSLSSSLVALRPGLRSPGVVQSVAVVAFWSALPVG